MEEDGRRRGVESEKKRGWVGLGESGVKMKT